MQPINFFVQGDPKGQPRARAFARKIGNTFVARVYDAGTAEGWKSQVALAAKPHIPFPPLSGPLEITVRLYFKRPKSHYTSKGLRENAPFWHTGKPDRDNCDKAILDALKTVGMFDDDCQVCAGPVEKYYSNGAAGADITIADVSQIHWYKNPHTGETAQVVFGGCSNKISGSTQLTGVQRTFENYPHHD